MAIGNSFTAYTDHLIFENRNANAICNSLYNHINSKFSDINNKFCVVGDFALELDGKGDGEINNIEFLTNSENLFHYLILNHGLLNPSNSSVYTDFIFCEFKDFNIQINLDTNIDIVANRNTANEITYIK